MTMEPVLTLADQADPVLREVIHDNFAAHAATKGLQADFRPLVIRVDRGGTLLGGLIGRTGRGWLYVEFLALPMADQGHGLGRRLMALAEEEAVRRGCHDAFLQTIAFQAPGFYQSLGYEEFARLPHADPRLTRIWFRRHLP